MHVCLVFFNPGTYGLLWACRSHLEILETRLAAWVQSQQHQKHQPQADPQSRDRPKHPYANQSGQASMQVDAQSALQQPHEQQDRDAAARGQLNSAQPNGQVSGTEQSLAQAQQIHAGQAGSSSSSGGGGGASQPQAQPPQVSVQTVEQMQAARPQGPGPAVVTDEAIVAKVCMLSPLLL
jgi:hypothetical protein